MAIGCAGLRSGRRARLLILNRPWPFNPGNGHDVHSAGTAALQHGGAAFDGGPCCKHVIDQQYALAGNPIPPAFVQLECTGQIALAASRAKPALAAGRPCSVQ